MISVSDNRFTDGINFIITDYAINDDTTPEIAGYFCTLTTFILPIIRYNTFKTFIHLKLEIENVERLNDAVLEKSQELYSAAYHSLFRIQRTKNHWFPTLHKPTTALEKLGLKENSNFNEFYDFTLECTTEQGMLSFQHKLCLLYDKFAHQRVLSLHALPFKLFKAVTAQYPQNQYMIAAQISHCEMAIIGTFDECNVDKETIRVTLFSPKESQRNLEADEESEQDAIQACRNTLYYDRICNIKKEKLRFLRDGSIYKHFNDDGSIAFIAKLRNRFWARQHDQPDLPFKKAFAPFILNERIKKTKI